MEKNCALLRMVEEAETKHEKIIRYISGNQSNTLSSFHNFELREYAKNHHMPREMDRTERSGNHIFEVDPSYSYLLDMTMYQILPEISVKEEFKNTAQICWCYYPGINIREKATFNCGEKKIPQSIDKHCADFDWQFFKSEKSEHNNRYCGHLPIYTEWETYLPKAKLIVPQEWFFCREFPFPIFLVKEKMYFSYRIKKNITDLLRVRIRNKTTGKWVQKKVTPEILKVLDVKDSTLDPPIMIAEYSKITKVEEDSIRKEDNFYIIEDYKHVESKIVKKNNPVEDVQLNFEEPIKNIFYAAENCDATAINNFSNYTTNAKDIEEGSKPIKSVEIFYDDVPILGGELTSEVLHDYLEAQPAKKYFPGAPLDPGYAAYTISNNMRIGEHDTFKSGKYKFTFILDDSEEGMTPKKDNNPFEDVEKNLRHNYKIHVCAVILRKLSFTSDGKLTIRVP